MGRLVCLPQPTTMTALVLSRGSFHGAPTNAQPTQPRRTTNRPLQRRSSARPRWHGCEAQATKSATSVFLHFSSQHRRSSTALYCSELGTADPDLAGPCPWGSPSTPPNCFLISDRPNAAKFYKVQMIIRRIQPLANDHSEDPASYK